MPKRKIKESKGSTAKSTAEYIIQMKIVENWWCRDEPYWSESVAQQILKALTINPGRSSIIEYLEETDTTT